MMPVAFWIKRFLFIAGATATALTAIGLLKGRSFQRSIVESLVWGCCVGAIVVATRLYRSRRGEKCDMCQDIPEKSE